MISSLRIPYSDPGPWEHSARGRRRDVGSNVSILWPGSQQAKQRLGSFEGHQDHLCQPRSWRSPFWSLEDIVNAEAGLAYHRQTLNVVVLTLRFLPRYLQLDPPPTEPLFLVTLHSIVNGLKELSDIEELGIDYNLHKSGVVPIYSIPLKHTQPEYKRGESYQA